MRKILACIAIVALCFVSVSEATLRVGFKENELDLPEGVSLAGYIQRRLVFRSNSQYARYFKSSIGKYNLPMVKSMAIDDGYKITFFVSLEVIAIEPDLKARAEALLAEKMDRPFEINIFATHTHSGPGGFVKFGLWQQLATDLFIKDLFESFVSAIADTSYDAYKNLEPARLSYGKGQLQDITYNRRESQFLNPQIHVLKFLNQNDSPLGTMINFPIHGTGFGPDNLKISGDIPGVVVDELGRKTNAPVIFVSGAAGDVGPKLDPDKINSVSQAAEAAKAQITYDKIHALGLRITNQILPIWQQTKLVKTEQVISKKFKIDLPQAQANLSLCLEAILPRGFQWISKLFFKINLPAELNRPMEVNMIELSPVTFYMIPGEPIGEIGAELERFSLQNKLPNPILMTLANSYYGYILSEKEYNRGGYETCNSFFGKKYGTTFLNGMMSSIASFSGFVSSK